MCIDVFDVCSLFYMRSNVTQWQNGSYQDVHSMCLSVRNCSAHTSRAPRYGACTQSRQRGERKKKSARIKYISLWRKSLNAFTTWCFFISLPNELDLQLPQLPTYCCRKASRHSYAASSIFKRIFFYFGICNDMRTFAINFGLNGGTWSMYHSANV